MDKKITDAKDYQLALENEINLLKQLQFKLEKAKEVVLKTGSYDDAIQLGYEIIEEFEALSKNSLIHSIDINVRNELNETSDVCQTLNSERHQLLISFKVHSSFSNPNVIGQLAKDGQCYLKEDRGSISARLADQYRVALKEDNQALKALHASMKKEAAEINTYQAHHDFYRQMYALLSTIKKVDHARLVAESILAFDHNFSKKTSWVDSPDIREISPDIREIHNSQEWKEYTANKDDIYRIPDDCLKRIKEQYAIKAKENIRQLNKEARTGDKDQALQVALNHAQVMGIQTDGLYSEKFIGFIQDLLVAIDQKEINFLNKVLSNMSNAASRHAFEHYTGKKLPKGVKATSEFLDQFCDISKEQRAQLNQEKEQAYQLKRLKENLKDSWEAIKETKVSYFSDGQQFTDTFEFYLIDLLQKNTIEPSIESTKFGAMNAYYLKLKDHKGNDFTISYHKHKKWNTLLKNMKAFGGLKNSLIELNPELDNKKTMSAKMVNR